MDRFFRPEFPHSVKNFSGRSSDVLMYQLQRILGISPAVSRRSSDKRSFISTSADLIAIAQDIAQESCY